MSKLGSDEKRELALKLKDEIKASEDARFLHRLHCVQMVAEGQSVMDVAHCFHDDPSTVSRWIRQFKEFGVEGLRDDKKSGRPSQLDFDQMKKLKVEISRPPCESGYYGSGGWSGKLLAFHLESVYSITLGLRQCQRLLRNIQDETDAARAQSEKDSATSSDSGNSYGATNRKREQGF